MEVIYVLIPGMILLGIILVLVLVIAIRKGQYDDLEGDGARILMDDDLMPRSRMPDADEQAPDRDKERDKERDRDG